MILNIGGADISVEKKRIKNMYIRVAPPAGEVRVTAPLRANNEAIERFILSRMDWIEAQKQKILNREVLINPEYTQGEIHYLWGEKYTLEVITTTKPRVIISDNKIVLYTKENSTKVQREKLIIDWYRLLLKQKIELLFSDCEKIVGVHANEWQVKNMHTRWGTCNVLARRVWLSLQLAQKPPECLRYVIIHELTHLLERGHGYKFKAYMDNFYPNWRQVRALMNGKNV